jgi:GT2 family glycosyltransferase
MSLNSEVCIIILNWNGKELLKDCLSSLFKLTGYPNYKVIVVDNGSTDGSFECVKKNFTQVDVLPLDKNYGFAKGNNKGIKYALKKYKPRYILLLNNDTKIIQRDWLTKLVETVESDKKMGLLAQN